MATMIKFTGGGELAVLVVQTADEVSSAVQAADGRPLQFEQAANGDPVFVNPGTIACWHPLDMSISPGRMT
jgi:hypothetical protein